ncbi:MAG TPA: hypothetical protein VMT27_05970 [Actinomycetes bacterium]|nr:hypothetical protein [Actinomycetes bacterium]
MSNGEPAEADLRSEPSPALADRPWRWRFGSSARVCAVTVLGGLAGGLVMGLLWWQVTPSVWLQVRSDGGYPEPSASGRWFAADGWFLILGVVLGAVLGLGAWLRGRNHPVGAVFGITIGGLLGAVLAWWVGSALGPPDAQSLLASAANGTRIELALGLRAMGVLLVPAITGLLAFVLLAAAASPRDGGERLAS